MQAKEENRGTGTYGQTIFDACVLGVVLLCIHCTLSRCPSVSIHFCAHLSLSELLFLYVASRLFFALVVAVSLSRCFCMVARLSSENFDFPIACTKS